MDAAPDYTALIALLPEPYRAGALLIIQLIGVLSLAVPVLRKIVALTTSKTDDRIMQTVDRVLSYIPRVQVPRLSAPPAAPPAKLEVTNWPTPEQLAPPKLPGDAPKVG